MQSPAPFSAHPTPYEPFADGSLDGDTVVQTRRCRRAPRRGDDSYPTPHVAFLPSAHAAARRNPAALVGTTLGDYELLDLLGRGGVGAVYKVRQRSQDRVAALKLLHAKHQADEVCVARFLNEARAAAALRHPNIIKVHQVSECDAGYYYAMEYIDGPSLEIMVREGEMSLLGIVNTMIRLAETLAYAHRRGFVHRDLKPANVLLDGPDRPVVIDFGLVKYLDEPAGLTRQGEVLGTPAYMAPEQAGGDPSRVGPASDVYALGAILYTLLTRCVPYDGGSSFSTILKVVGPDMPPLVRSLNSAVPEELERVCMTCLSKAPEDRYASAEELADELRRVREIMIRDQL